MSRSWWMNSGLGLSALKARHSTSWLSGTRPTYSHSASVRTSMMRAAPSSRSRQASAGVTSPAYGVSRPWARSAAFARMLWTSSFMSFPEIDDRRGRAARSDRRCRARNPSA
jgi:hypothetical protein